MTEYVCRLLTCSALAAILLVDSSLPAPRTPPANPHAPTLLVEVAGCESMLAGPVCEMSEEGTLRIWVRSEPDADLSLASDGMPPSTASSGQPSQGRQVWTFLRPKDVFKIVITATSSGARTHFVLPLRPAVPMYEIAQADALRKQDRIVEAEALLDQVASDANERVQAAAMGIRARIHRQHETPQSIGEAIRMFREAADRHRATGRLSAAVREEITLAYVYIYYGRHFAEARQALARAEAMEREIPAGQTELAYYKGLLAYETGDWRAALHHMRLAYEGAVTLDLPAFRADALSIEAFMLQMLGRQDEGEAMFLEAEQAATAVSDPCVLADLWANQGWFFVSSREHKPQAGEVLHKALEAYGTICQSASARGSVLTDLSVLALRQGHVDQARSWLAEARRSNEQPDPRIQVWWHHIEGQVALQEGRPRDALRIYETLADLAEIRLLIVARFHATLGRARALEALGRELDAGAAYEQAEEMLWEKSLLVPAGEGREGFLGSFDESSRAAIEFFLKRDPSKAAAIARRARARSLATLRWIDRVGALGPEQRDAWDRAIAAYREGREQLGAEAAKSWRDLSQLELDRKKGARKTQEAELARQLDQAIASLWHDAPQVSHQLPAPPEGEVTLVVHPLEKGWAGFAITRERTSAKMLGELDFAAGPAALARAVLLPFQDELSRAQRVRFVASGAIEKLDLHALAWERGPLIASLPVVYGVDAGERASALYRPTGEPAVRRALVVGDPRGGLLHAQRVARTVATTLEQAGWQVTRLFGSEATEPVVHDALNRQPLDLFHYSGHGRFAGRGGWESGLLLADGTELDVGHILALPQAPRLVVLSACEGAMAEGKGAVAGLGLAQAFVLAGASAVVASTRTVRDAVAADVMEAFYGWSRGQPLEGIDWLSLSDDAAMRLRRATLALQTKMPDGDWSSFRLLVP